MGGKRCDWAEHNDLERDYHDQEWGKPLHDEHLLFELLVLESMQAGLSWLTILKKRETLKQAYDAFDYQKISLYGEDKIAQLLVDPGIIRHNLKIRATINNANRFMDIQKEHGSFDCYIWSFVDRKPIINQWETITDVPASTPLSDEISKELKKKGFKFLGTTTVYAYMQAIGMVNDHLVSCDFR
ncbi:DNA-3-methyladenine glycosylase I [Vagococcus sp.]|uniref:DNA-3-methyladenine glycosylase I n=1 Tax=Vagococcus sp. TaxID=1933889 RepID=UPI003F9AB2FE